MSRRAPKPEPSRRSRISVVRLIVAGIIIGTLVLAFTNLLGPFRVIFRGVVLLGVIVIVLSYVIEWWLKLRRRASAAGR